MAGTARWRGRRGGERREGRAERAMLARVSTVPRRRRTTGPKAALIAPLALGLGVRYSCDFVQRELRPCRPAGSLRLATDDLEIGRPLRGPTTSGAFIIS